MKNMKTFITYLILFLVMYFTVNILSNGLILSMYKDIKGYEYPDSDIVISVDKAKATNVNGYMNFKVKNETGKVFDEKYLKIDFLSEYHRDAISKYIVLSDFDKNEEKTYKVKFRGEKIAGYRISEVDEIPNKDHILNVLGWEIDLTNVFGTGLNVYDAYENIKNTLGGMDEWESKSRQLAIAGGAWVKSIPFWAYAIALYIVLWNL